MRRGSSSTKCPGLVISRCFLQLTKVSCYVTVDGIYLSACRVSRGLLGGVEKAYMKGAFDTGSHCCFQYM